MPSERGQVVDNESHRKRLETISRVSFNVVYMLKARCRINGGSDQTQVRPLMFCRRTDIRWRLSPILYSAIS